MLEQVVLEFPPIGIVEVKFGVPRYSRWLCTPIGLSGKRRYQSTAVSHIDKNMKIGNVREINLKPHHTSDDHAYLPDIGFVRNFQVWDFILPVLPGELLVGC